MLTGALGDRMALVIRGTDHLVLNQVERYGRGPSGHPANHPLPPSIRRRLLSSSSTTKPFAAPQPFLSFLQLHFPFSRLILSLSLSSPSPPPSLLPLPPSPLLLSSPLSSLYLLIHINLSLSKLHFALHSRLFRPSSPPWPVPVAVRSLQHQSPSSTTSTTHLQLPRFRYIHSIRRVSKALLDH
ncbi:hypothetical protein ASPTUDRAFT_289998 [Aspergillus tubingensis CBS 134.48]|uniref:Uncharacterized protein n=1 Tax=Aspergillus tubingensis (strain CBS 134.48) TaxID=767770 RepID=A0A1L9NP41_ASPTC|nr:hypothetical protein ASPTUDRAFT_289998 [Aspergillus tubingensis CBS 134.48]